VERLARFFLENDFCKSVVHKKSMERCVVQSFIVEKGKKEKPRNSEMYKIKINE
jgi:hypothetical protein